MDAFFLIYFFHWNSQFWSPHPGTIMDERERWAGLRAEPSIHHPPAQYEAAQQVFFLQCLGAQPQTNNNKSGLNWNVFSRFSHAFPHGHPNAGRKIYAFLFSREFFFFGMTVL